VKIEVDNFRVLILASIRGWLHVCNFMCDLHANRRCDLVYLRFRVRQESSSIFYTCRKSHTKSHLRHQIAATTPNLSCDVTPNRICNLAFNFVSVLQLKRHQIAHGIAHKIACDIAQQIEQQIAHEIAWYV
jgi:hypothetical protein